jgi:hypothetical protein
MRSLVWANAMSYAMTRLSGISLAHRERFSALIKPSDCPLHPSVLEIAV